MKTVPVRQIVYIALFAALFVVMSAVKFKLPITPVPVTLQTLAVMLAGAFLGPRLGFFSILSVVALTALGLPLLGGEGGIAVITGYTGGFIFMFPVSALVVGYAVKRFLGTKLASNRIAAFCILFAIFQVLTTCLLYVGGVPWLADYYDLTIAEALKSACYPFLLFDTIKALLAAFIMVTLYTYAPVFRQARRTSVHYAD